MTLPTRDKRLEKGAETKGRLLLCAIDIIAKDGVSGLTAGKLSIATQVSKSSIFHHFKSIDDIPLAALDMLMHEMLRPVKSREYRTLEEYLDYLGQALLETTESQRSLYKAFFSFYHASLFNKLYRDQITNYLEVVKKDISKELSQLLPVKIPDPDLHELSLLVITALDGIGLHILMGNTSDSYHNVWKLLKESICQRIQKGEAHDNS